MDQRPAEEDRTTPDRPVDQTGPDQDRFGRNGMLAVGGAAAVLSFQIWVQLAQAVGFTAHWTIPATGINLWIAWLYPIAIDVYALLVTREWLRSAPGSRLRKWAKTNSIGAIGLSFLGQGAFHAFDGRTPPTWFVVAMGGMPPLVVGLTVHLYTMRGRGEGAAPIKVARPKRANRMVPSPAGPVHAEVVQPVIEPDQRPSVDRRSAGRGVVRELRPAYPVVAQSGGPVVDRMVAQLAGAFDQVPLDQLPGRRPLMAHFGWTSAATAAKAIGRYRATREVDQPAEQTTEDDDSKERTA